MKALLLLVALVAIAGVSGFENCALKYANNSLFNLCPFAQDAPFNIKFGTINTEKLNLTLGSQGQSSCNASREVWATYEDTLNDCTDIVDSPTLSLMNISDPNGGLLITFPAVNATSGLTYSAIELQVELTCDMSLTDSSATNFAVNNYTVINGIYYITATGASRYGCPYASLNMLIQFFKDNATIFAIVFGVLGVILTFFGLRFVNFTVFVIVTILGMTTVGSLFFELVDLSSAKWLLWLVFVVSLLAGCFLGYVAVKYEKVAYFLLGGALGLVGGLILYSAVIAPIVKDSGSATPLYITVGIAALLGAILSFLLLEGIIIFTTGVVGAYITVRAISSFIPNNGFPSEADVASGNVTFNAIIYAYLAGIIILAILGIYCQFHLKPKKDDDLEENLPVAGGYYGNANYNYKF